MRSSGVHTPSSCPAHNSFASARASRRSVFARAWRMPVSLGETTITRATCGSRIRAIATHCPSPPTRPGRADRDSARTAQAPPVWSRSAPPTQPTLLGEDRHLTEIAMHIQRYRPHLVLLAVGDEWQNRWANDIDGSALAAQPGKSQGRPQKLPGSKPIVQNGLPNLRSPRKPLVPVSRT
jgi:hypothetical protein